MVSHGVMVDFMASLYDKRDEIGPEETKESIYEIL